MSHSSSNEFSGRERLRSSSLEFCKEIIQITEGVFTAVGYSASNVTLIQGDSGSIIVDIAANPVDARAIIDAFGERMSRPVRGIIYTHNHPDHSGSATIFAGYEVTRRCCNPVARLHGDRAMAATFSALNSPTNFLSMQSANG